MRRANRRAEAGFTLVELLVGVVVSLVVVAGAITLLAAQKRSFQGSNADRAQQETARMALEEISQNLRMAGYGVEPSMVFDFGQMIGVPMERAPQGPGDVVTFGGDSAGTTGFACGSAVECRDDIAGPDQLAFQYRSPSFNHRISSATSATSLVIDGPLRQPLRRGQVLQAVCMSGSMVWAYLRVGVDVAATQTTDPVTVPLEAGTALEYPHQNRLIDPTTGDTCFRTGLARLLKVERLRYLVQSYDAAGAVTAWNAAGSRPFLMLDRGLFDAVGNPDLEVVTPDVEDFQVSYIFPLGTAGQQVAGVTPGTRLGNSSTGIDLAPAGGMPRYETARLSPLRGTRYPANVRAVRVAVVVRPPNADATLVDETTIPAAGNRPALTTGQPGYRRMLFETSVALPNMEARAPFFPFTGTGTDQLNVSGG
jgi:type IV pilus assembly protein PilW